MDQSEDRSGMVAFLLLVILLMWLYITGRITGAIDAVTGRRVLR